MNPRERQSRIQAAVRATEGQIVDVEINIALNSPHWAWLEQYGDHEDQQNAKRARISAAWQLEGLRSGLDNLHQVFAAELAGGEQ